MSSPEPTPERGRPDLLVTFLGLAVVLILLAVGTTWHRSVERNISAATAERDSLSDLVRVLRRSVETLGDELDASRCALGAASGINAYHDGDFTLAVQLYDTALACDPADGNVLHLKAYSLFKSGDLGAAIATQRAGLAAMPDNAWGHFNLARYLCAAGEREASDDALATAVSLAPEMAAVARDDGEFQFLCRRRALP